MSKYRYFDDSELYCKCDACKDKEELLMDEDFMNWVVELREKMRFQFIVTSAYRCKDHPAEARKSVPGAHNSGKAIDIKVSGKRAYKLLREALTMGFVGVGVSQKGDHSSRFIHIDMDFEKNRPTVWSY